MTEATFVTTFVMGARLPWPDDSPGLAERGPFEPGTIHQSGLRQPCSIRKISALGATVRAQLKTMPGDSITVELATGQRPSAIVQWASGGEIGIGFDEPVDMLALINRTLVNQPAERRAMPRVEIRCGAFIRKGADIVPVTIRNISARGLQVEGEILPAAGAFVSLFIDGLNIPSGEVAWSKGKLAGIELLDELNWSSIMPWIRALVGKQAQ